jgi:hypothetical protein
MFVQIADRANPKPLRVVTPHDKRIGVVETQRLRHPDAEFRQRISNFLDRQLPLGRENFLRDRSRIFRIDIDLPRVTLPKE